MNQVVDIGTFDLCSSLLEEMKKLEFNPISIQQVEVNHYFQRAIGQEPATQRPYLTLTINSIFLKGPEVVPSNIRLALNIGQDTEAWLTDLKIVLLPFLKANEGLFFY